MDLRPNHGEAVYEIRNLLRYGIDCKASVWNPSKTEWNQYGVLYGIKP